jgi:hypothetical protein
MSSERACPKCGSVEVIPHVRIVAQTHRGKTDLLVEVYEHPGALLFKGTHAGALTARICGMCGFAELFVSNPQELLAAYRKHGEA